MRVHTHAPCCLQGIGAHGKHGKHAGAGAGGAGGAYTEAEMHVLFAKALESVILREARAEGGKDVEGGGAIAAKR